MTDNKVSLKFTIGAYKSKLFENLESKMLISDLKL